jgi:hypothetical protein
MKVEEEPSIPDVRNTITVPKEAKKQDKEVEEGTGFNRNSISGVTTTMITMTRMLFYLSIQMMVLSYRRKLKMRTHVRSEAIEPTPLLSQSHPNGIEVFSPWFVGGKCKSS